MGTCSIFGHADFRATKTESEKLKEIIIDCIKNKNITNFYVGDKGNYDVFSTKILNEVKTIYPYINIYLIIHKYREKITPEDKSFRDKYYNFVIYPNLENTPPKFAISKRNKFMIDNSNFVIFHVDYIHNISKFLNYTIKKKIDFINLGKYNG